MVHIIGTCVVKNPLSEKSLTTYGGGSKEELAGKSLRVITRNSAGDLLCLNEEGTALADIDKEDVEDYTPRTPPKAIELSVSMADLFAPLKKAQGE